MALRYKDGKANRFVNVIADHPNPVCFCRFQGVGKPLNAWECSVHSVRAYSCDQCKCGDYRPNREKKNPGDWPRCVCGHIAQEHN